VKKICILCGSPPYVHDAVGDVCWFLAQELARESSVSLLVPTQGAANANGDGPISIVPIHGGWGVRTAREVLQHVSELKPDVVLVHFVPQLYGWNGAKPGLAILLQMLRRRGFRIVTVGHEFSAPFGLSPKLAMWSMIHRLLLRMVVRASRQVVLTTPMRCDIIQRRFASRRGDILTIPIGSTVPVLETDRACDREEFDRAHGIRQGELVVATFGSPMPAVVAMYGGVFRELSASGIPFRVMVIGKSGEQFRRSLLEHWESSDGTYCTGPVSNAELSRLLSRCDLYVTLYPDGASTHRTSLLAGLAHGLPTVSNRGTSTEPYLVSSGAIALIDDPARGGDVSVVRELSRHAELRARLGERGRKFHDEHHSWSQIGSQYLRLICNAAEGN
jgi:glycosyltransferase involved in cell wall biosynthesis